MTLSVPFVWCSSIGIVYLVSCRVISSMPSASWSEPMCSNSASSVIEYDRVASGRW